MISPLAKCVSKELEAVEEGRAVHYRVVYDKQTRETFIACLQDFDYSDYEHCGFVDDTHYATEAEAESARRVSHYYHNLI